MKKPLLLGGIAILAASLAMPVSANAATQYVGPGEPGFGNAYSPDLVQPRGLAFDKHGQLWVVEAGSGGGGPCFTTADGPEGPEQQCFGMSGRLTQLRNNERMVVKELPSVAGSNGDEATDATGPVDIQIREDDSKVVLMGGVGTVDNRKLLGKPGEIFGRVIRIDKKGKISKEADLLKYEKDKNPDGNQIDSNPYGIVLAGAKAYVADAGANALLRVDDKGMGKVSKAWAIAPRDVLAPPFLGLPPGATIPQEAVPNTVTMTSNGTILFAELTGFPFEPGSARVLKLTSNGYEVVAENFTNIIDITTDAAGNIYVLEYSAVGLVNSESFNEGRLTKIAPNGTRTVIVDELRQPGGVAVRDGYAYVTTCAVCTDGGGISRFATS